MFEGIEINADQTEGSVSVAVTRRIKPGCERAYEELVKGIHEAIKGFDGYLGSHILHPPSADHSEYQIIFRFDSAEHLHAWETSPERREWLDRMSGLIVGTPTYHVLSGLETWFTLPAVVSRRWWELLGGVISGRERHANRRREPPGRSRHEDRYQDLDIGATGQRWRIRPA
jgi:antibiotic biosynthesis monooxygenase (ABM) superfamily enzyme